MSPSFSSWPTEEQAIALRFFVSQLLLLTQHEKSNNILGNAGFRRWTARKGWRGKDSERSPFHLGEPFESIAFHLSAPFVAIEATSCRFVHGLPKDFPGIGY